MREEMLDLSAIDDNTDEGKYELSLIVARLLGYTVHPNGSRYMLVAPHDREYTPDDWNKLIQWGGDYSKRISEVEAWHDIPEFAEDFDYTVSTLIEDMPGTFHLIQKAKGIWQSWFNLPVIDTLALGDSPAVAACKSWIKYKTSVLEMEQLNVT